MGTHTYKIPRKGNGEEGAAADSPRSTPYEEARARESAARTALMQAGLQLVQVLIPVGVGYLKGRVDEDILARRQARAQEEATSLLRLELIGKLEPKEGLAALQKLEQSRRPVTVNQCISAPDSVRVEIKDVDE